MLKPNKRGISSYRELDLVAIPGGEVEIGSTLDEVQACIAIWQDRLVDPAYRPAFGDWIRKEYPRHRVRIAAFHIGRFPVTNQDYIDFAATTGHPIPESIVIGSPARHPVWGVDYDDALAYALWLGDEMGIHCRLPSEAEWECAARGPDHAEYPFGNSFDPARCNTMEGGVGTTTPVDHYPQGASGYGVLDMGGNVEEWTSSFYLPYPGGDRIDDDISSAVGAHYRTLRGGSFALGGDLARSARRHGPHPAPQFRYRGFRVVVA